MQRRNITLPTKTSLYHKRLSNRVTCFLKNLSRSKGYRRFNSSMFKVQCFRPSIAPIVPALRYVQIVQKRSMGPLRSSSQCSSHVRFQVQCSRSTTKSSSGRSSSSRRSTPNHRSRRSNRSIAALAPAHRFGIGSEFGFGFGFSLSGIRLPFFPNGARPGRFYDGQVDEI
jgi:hypothetical protein